MPIYPDSIRDPRNPTEVEHFLERMRQTPSQLPNMSVYDVAEREPEHFRERMVDYAKILGGDWADNWLNLWGLTQDFGPLERAVKKCTLLPETAETFRRELPGLMRTY